MNYVPKLGGWRSDKSHPDSAKRIDHKFDELKTSLKRTIVNATVDLRKYCSPVEDQGQAGSCVANATVGSLEMLQIKNGVPFIDLSRLFIYYNARLMDGTQTKDDGSYIHLAFGTLSSLGTCPEKTWPYDLAKLFIRPSWESYREGYPNKIHQFYRIDDGPNRIDDIKFALESEHPVVFGMLVDQDFMDTGSDGMIEMPAKSRSNVGGHALMIVGYTSDNRFIIRNSWGNGWGDQGYCYVPFDYLDASDANDFWVPTVLM